MKRYFFVGHIALFCIITIALCYSFGWPSLPHRNFCSDFWTNFGWQARYFLLTLPGSLTLQLLIIPFYFSPAFIWSWKALGLAEKTSVPKELTLISLGSILVFVIFAVSPMLFFLLPYGAIVSAMIYVGTFSILSLDRHARYPRP